MTENLKAILEAALKEIRALKSHPTATDDDHASYGAGRDDAACVIQEAIDNIPERDLTLTRDDQAAQAERCGCRGADDYCPCQNVPDRETLAQRSIKLASIRAAIDPR